MNHKKRIKTLKNWKEIHQKSIAWKSRLHSKPQSLDLSTDQRQRSDKIIWCISVSISSRWQHRLHSSAGLSIWDQNQLLGTRILPGMRRRGDKCNDKSKTCFHDWLNLDLRHVQAELELNFETESAVVACLDSKCYNSTTQLWKLLVNWHVECLYKVMKK